MDVNRDTVHLLEPERFGGQSSRGAQQRAVAKHAFRFIANVLRQIETGIRAGAQAPAPQRRKGMDVRLARPSRASTTSPVATRRASSCLVGGEVGFQCREQGLHVLRQRRLRLEWLARDRMLELQPGCVQGLPRELA